MVKNNCCGDGVSSTFLKVMRCSLIFLAVLRCSGLPHVPLLTRLRKIRVIKPVDTQTDWVSSLVVVKKPIGKLRVCIDPKPLDKALKRSHYPLLVIDDLLLDLSKAKVFSICEVKNGFCHVELDEASSYLTTFGTPFGRYC